MPKLIADKTKEFTFKSTSGDETLNLTKLTAQQKAELQELELELKHWEDQMCLAGMNCTNTDPEILRSYEEVRKKIEAYG